LIIVGSIFVPLIAIMLVDYFLVQKQQVVPEDLLVEDKTSKFWYNNGYNWSAIAIWIVGVLFYNLLYYVWTPLGSTLPAFIVTSILYYIVAKMKEGRTAK
jgi:cytosine/uracil/thiamine/allantoin permease